MPRKQELPKGLFWRGGVLWCTYTADRSRRESCNTSDVKAALAILETKKAAIHEGRFFPGKRKNNLTVQGLSDLWFKNPDVQKKKSKKDDEQRFATIVELLGPDTLVNSLGLAEMQDLQSKLSQRVVGKNKKRPITGATINRHWALLASALTHAALHKYQHQNPLEGIKRAPERHKDDIFTDAEFQELVKHRTVKPDRLLVMWVGFETGMRLSEILGMTWDRVNLTDDLNRRGMRLRECDSKTGNPIIVPISDRLLAVLKAHKAIRDALPVRQLKKNETLVQPVRVSAFSAWFSKIAKELGYTGTFHALRHTAISKLNDAGVPLKTIMSIVGHKTPATTMRYMTVSTAQKNAAVARLASVAIVTIPGNQEQSAL